MFLSNVFASLLLFAAIPASREYVDTKVQQSEQKVLQETTKYVDGKMSETTLLYDDKHLPPQNALDSNGNMYRVSTTRAVGGKWTIGQVVEEQVVTYEASYVGNADNIFTWKKDDIFIVTYNLTNGVLNVKYSYGELKEGIYDCGTYNNPLKNKLEKFEYVSGYKFDSLNYVSQGPLVKEDTAYESLVKKSVYDVDRANTVTSVNGQKGAVVIDIPEVSDFAKKTYVDGQVGAAEGRMHASVFTEDAYSRQYTEASIPGRINILEQTAKKQQQSLVNYLWSENMLQVMNAFGEIFDTVYETHGHWERTTILNPDAVLEYYDTASESDNLFIWKSSANHTMTYCPTNGAVTQDSLLLGYTATNLNPTYSHELGSFTNTVDRNILNFKKRGYVRAKTRKDIAVFEGQLADKTVTGISHDGMKNGDGSPKYETGKVLLPDYKTDYDSKFLTKDLDGDWTTDATDKSLVGIVKRLEIGGQNVTTNLTRVPMSDYLDDVTQTNDSIVGTLYRVNRDFASKDSVKDIAEAEVTNKVDKQFIKSKGFYDTNEVDTIIASKLDDKRIKYLYDDIDNPTQMVDSKGNLYHYGLENFGGRYELIYSVGGNANYGTYTYAGLIDGKNVWTNQNQKQIWYNPSTGAMGDPDATYEGSESKKNLNPENCDVIPDINTANTKATFFKQISTEKQRYTQPYDKFAQNSAIQKTIDDKIDVITNNLPQLYLAESSVTRQFNPYFTVSPNFNPGVSENTYVKITSSNTIKIPVDTVMNSTIELSFIAKLTYHNALNVVQNFIKSSNENVLPSIGPLKWSTEGYFDFGILYPTYESVGIGYMPGFIKGNDVFIKIRLEKNSGPMTLFASNMVDNVVKTFTGFVNVNRSKADYWTLQLDEGYNYNGDYMLNVDSLVLKLDNTEEKLIGQYASDYTKVNKLYADKELGNANGIKLELATPEKYGMVKPDGETIKINAAGKLYAENTGGGGGASTEEIVGMMSKTNITFFTLPTANSVVGKTLNNEQNIIAVSNKVETLDGISKEILEQLKAYNTRLENALNGN